VLLGVAAARDITLAQLVTHTSGLPGALDEADDEADDDGATDDDVGSVAAEDGSDGEPSAEERAAQRLLQQLAELPLEFDPGTRCEASDNALALARLVVERAARRGFRDHAAATLFEPADLEHTEVCPRIVREVPEPEQILAEQQEGEADALLAERLAVIWPYIMRPLRSSSLKCSQVLHRGTRFALANNTRGASGCVVNTPTGLPDWISSVSSSPRARSDSTMRSNASQFLAALPVPP
jgi:CubicO group peptidase (beta-lactamase class C family)